MQRRFSPLIIAITIVAGCTEHRDDSFTPLLSGEAQHEALPPPAPACDLGVSGVSAFLAAQMIAERHCVVTGEDYNMACIAPIVARYCPDVPTCQVDYLCNEELPVLHACQQTSPPSPDCVVLFPTTPVTPVEAVTWTPPYGHKEHNVTTFAGLGFIGAVADFSYVDGVPAAVSVGASIVGLRLRLRGPSGSGTGYGTDTVLSLRRANGDGTANIVGRLTVPTPPPPTWQTYAVTLPSPVRAQDGQSFEFMLYLGTADVAVSGIGLVTL